MREVKLKIDAEGIVKAALCIKNMKNMDKVVASCDRVSYLAILKNILDRNIRIESEHKDGKEKTILDIVKNDIYQCFTHNEYMAPSANNLHYALKHGNDRSIRQETIYLINDLITPNTLIYSPEHGIYIQVDRNEPLESIDSQDDNADLSTRTYTLQVDDENLENVLQITSENLDRQNLCYLSILPDLKYMAAIKKYSSVEEFYTLDELYTLTKDGVPLVDYGLRLIHEKYHDIVELVDLIEEVKVISNKPQDTIKKEVSELFTTEEDLRIAISISNHVEQIEHEKKMHSYMISMMECIENSTDLLDEKDGSKVLKIKQDLSDFYENYVHSTGLIDIIFKKGDKLSIEREAMSECLDAKKEEYNKKEGSLEEWKKETNLSSQDYAQTEKEKKDEIKALKRSINHLENDMNLQEWAIKRVALKYGDICTFQNIYHILSSLIPAQRDCIVKKMKEFGKLQKIKVVVAEEKREALKSKYTQVNTVKILAIAVVSITVLALSASLLKNKAVKFVCLN
ncbi:hypothetical protein NEMIN01_2119 [Nematocida minor]|uniref:uncharacterized protein n=1 Tax=Nematocida minor TaxID=1912983 RepID=UPI00221E720C|nr:uncharacterized protein NEMIN01_2119 [Nematocida minor]KAI5192620.1 hypothetical protein NEMIN01_2119 [Nematocida minor]